MLLHMSAHCLTKSWQPLPKRNHLIELFFLAFLYPFGVINILLSPCSINSNCLNIISWVVTYYHFFPSWRNNKLFNAADCIFGNWFLTFFNKLKSTTIFNSTPSKLSFLPIMKCHYSLYFKP